MGCVVWRVDCCATSGSIFGAEAGGFRDPEVLAGTMAHEVAHVFRRVHALEVDDSDLEERLTDLTTIWLGFGVLTTNASLKHRSHGDFNYHAWSRNSVGYLPPQAMSFLLALQAQARELDAGGLRYIAGLLEANQRAYFEKACAWIAAELPMLGERLGLPDSASWPEPTGSAPVWWWGGAAAFVGLAVLGGRAVPMNYCSDPTCKAQMSPQTEVCLGCQGVVAGVIASADRRLEALEGLERAGRLPGAAKPVRRAAVSRGARRSRG